LGKGDKGFSDRDAAHTEVGSDVVLGNTVTRAQVPLEDTIADQPHGLVGPAVLVRDEGRHG
jgi:hypothetical protein